MNADDDDGGERQYVNIDSMEGKQTIFTLHISMAARQYRLTLVCDAYTMNKSLNFDSNKSNYIPWAREEAKNFAITIFVKFFFQYRVECTLLTIKTQIVRTVTQTRTQRDP